MNRREDHLELIFNKLHGISVEDEQDGEFLEMMFSAVLPKKQARSASKIYMDKYDDIRSVFDAPPEELRGLGDLGYKPAVLIGLIKKSAEFYLKEKIVKRDLLAGSQDVVNYLKWTLASEKVEKFMALYLNSKMELLDMEVINEGIVNQTVVYPRKILEYAFKHNAAAIIFVHNHPSGDPTPSLFDRELTKKLVAAAMAVDIAVHDHIIIGKGGTFSAREDGWFGDTSRAIAMKIQNKSNVLHE